MVVARSGATKLSALKRVIGDIGLGALGLAVGAAAFVLYQTSIGAAANEQPLDTALVIGAPAVGPGAGSPEAAVRAFLDAAVAGDAQVAFELLSEADRGRVGSAELWAVRRPIGDVRSWHWDDEAALVATLAVEPGLSLTRGWSPVSTTFAWKAVDEDGWRIALGESSAQALVPDASSLATNASAWLDDPARCAGPPAPNLVLAAPTSSFDALCRTGGTLAGTDSSPVSGRLAADLELAYGPGAATWARTIPLDGGAQLILAAVGEQWVVIDAVNR